ncbi:unnamed protein product, partial [Symbiodinium necroappetens]
MLGELDFREEQKNLDVYRDFLDENGLTAIAVAPKPYPEASSKRVLTMERLSGVPLVDLEGIKKYTADPEATLVNALNVWALSVQKCEFFHADVHAGNLLVLEDGRVGFIDFGIVGRLSPQMATGIDKLNTALAAGVSDARGMANALISMGATVGKVDEEAFAADIQKLISSLGNTLDNTTDMAVDESKIQDIVLDIAQVAGNNGLKLPREFGLLIKQSLYFDRYTKLLAPDLNMMSDDRIANFGQARVAGAGPPIRNVTLHQKSLLKPRLQSQRKRESTVWDPSSPSWVAPIAQFVDQQCIIFEDEEENKLEYTECHNEFRQLIDNLLAAHLLELDVSNEQFEQFCQTGLSTNSTLHRVLVEQLLAVDDFLIFKAMMTKRNADLYREAQRRVDAGQLDEEDFHETTVVDDDEEVLAGLGEMTVEASLVADEWKMYEDQLFQALDESQKADDELARQRQKEEEELERALVLSLQMEEERMHGLAGEAANASPSSSSAAGQDAAPPPPAPPPPSEAASAAPVEASAAP